MNFYFQKSKVKNELIKWDVMKTNVTVCASCNIDDAVIQVTLVKEANSEVDAGT